MMSFEGKIVLGHRREPRYWPTIAETFVARGAKVIGTATSESGAEAISSYPGANGKGFMLNVVDAHLSTACWHRFAPNLAKSTF